MEYSIYNATPPKTQFTGFSVRLRIRDVGVKSMTGYRGVRNKFISKSEKKSPVVPLMRDWMRSTTGLIMVALGAWMALQGESGRELGVVLSAARRFRFHVTDWGRHDVCC